MEGLTPVRIDIVDTAPHAAPMAKLRENRTQFRGATAIGERPDAAPPKGSINLRIEAQTRRLIDEAAALQGKTRTEFMVESARAQAIDVLLDQRLFTLDGASFEGFVAALDDPPVPGPKLRALLRRRPAWGA